MIGLVLLLLSAVALVEAGRLVRDARRARRLNRAMHELRRPLQSIAMTLKAQSPDLAGAEDCLRQARYALRELDATVNGGRTAPIVCRTRIGDVVDSLERRWAFADIEVEAPTCEQDIEADVDRLGAALDNLVANALRHGSGPVRVRASSDGRKARFEVRDGGPRTRLRPGPGDPRHGHGTAIVASVAGAHGGTVDRARQDRLGGTLAAISLPVAGGGLPG